jgi:hypothetical protein
MRGPVHETKLIKAEVMTTLRARFPKKGRADRSEADRGGMEVEMDAEDGLLACHFGVDVYRLDSRMLPTHLIYSADPEHLNLAHVAFGGQVLRTLHMVQAMTGEILVGRLQMAGKKLYAHPNLRTEAR